MSWIVFGLLVVVAVGVLVIPGLLITASLKLRGLSAIAYSPILGLGAVGLWTLVWGATSWRWDWLAWLVLVAVLLALALLTRRRNAARVGASFGDNRGWYALAGIIVFAAIQAASLVPGIGSPSGIPHLGDAGFHLQAAILIEKTGSVFPTTALSDLYTPGETSSVFYPTLWHGWVVLLMAFAGAAEATNAAVFALSLLVWPASVVALALSLGQKSSSIAFWTPTLLAPIAVFPGALAVAYSVYPFALATVALPAALGALILWIRSGKIRSPFGVLYFVAVVGAAVAQPTGVIFPIYAALVAVLLLTLRWVWRQWADGSRVKPLFAAISLLVAAAVSLLVMKNSAYLSQLASYPRPQVLDDPIKGFFDGTVAAISESWLPWLITVALSAGGALLVARSIEGWTYLITTATAIVAFIAAAGPHSPLRALTGPWYKDHVRLAAIATVLVVSLAAVLLAWFWDKLVTERVRPAVGLAIVGIVSVCFIAFWYVVSPRIEHVETSHIRNGYAMSDSQDTTLTEDTAAVLERLDQHFEPGDRVLVAYRNGGGFVSLLSDLEPMLPLDGTYTEDQRVLVTNLEQINTDPQVCSIMRKHNVTAFVADLGRDDRESLGVLAGPPYLDISEGYELVDQQGSVKVWRITGCE